MLSTHILPEVEAICRRVLLISKGRIRIDGPLEEVKGGGRLEDVFLREAAADVALSNGEPRSDASGPQESGEDES